ncbi:MAG: heavy-metal-associated domain-containing protein [Candidatus Methylomirabilales bacterium]
MERLDDVKRVGTNFERRETSVEYDRKLVTVEKLITTIEHLGYKARVATPNEGGGK